MDLTDNHPDAKRKGILALQLHRGPAMKVEFKDIQLRRLVGEEAATALSDAIESGKKKQPKEDAPKPDIVVYWLTIFRPLTFHSTAARILPRPRLTNSPQRASRLIARLWRVLLVRPVVQLY